jgi:DNA-binding transcriptional MerR regulator
LRIGELSRASGVTASRIRFYETAGLLAPTGRTPAGYRLYGDEAVQALRIIDQAQLAGFTLAEIKSLLPQPRGLQWDRVELLEALHSKAATIDELVRQLTETQQRLRTVIAEVEHKPDDLTCVDNAERVISRLLGTGQEQGVAGTPLEPPDTVAFATDTTQ